ncbi:hypothetical protein RJ640_000519, partial [Escallonia rubra]
KCESEYCELWLKRNKSILDRLLELRSSIICLQEFWVANEELVRMYEKRLGDAGYVTYKLARTNNRGDGLLTAVHQNHFHVLNYRECLFNDIGDRVAQLFHVELLTRPESQSIGLGIEALLVNTHLIFPHDSTYCFLRLQQIPIKYQHNLPPKTDAGIGMAVRRGMSVNFCCRKVLSHPMILHITTQAMWVSHCNHRGNICAVDFIWLFNPNKSRKPLKQSFLEALIGNVNNLLRSVPKEVNHLVPFLETDNSYITSLQFSQALAE